MRWSVTILPFALINSTIDLTAGKTAKLRAEAFHGSLFLLVSDIYAIQVVEILVDVLVVCFVSSNLSVLISPLQRDIYYLESISPILKMLVFTIGVLKASRVVASLHLFLSENQDSEKLVFVFLSIFLFRCTRTFVSSSSLLLFVVGLGSSVWRIQQRNCPLWTW